MIVRWTSTTMDMSMELFLQDHTKFHHYYRQLKLSTKEDVSATSKAKLIRTFNFLKMNLLHEISSWIILKPKAGNTAKISI